MQSEAKDRSIMESVARRRERSARLSELAKSLGRDRSAEAMQEEAIPEASSEETPMELWEPTVSPAESPADSLEEAVEHENAEEMLGQIGPGNSDYGILGELMPQFDFDAIPLTQPKRVLAKSETGEQAVSPSKSSNAKNGATSPRRKKNPASLLDSYFKGL